MSAMGPNVWMLGPQPFWEVMFWEVVVSLGDRICWRKYVTGDGPWGLITWLYFLSALSDPDYGAMWWAASSSWRHNGLDTALNQELKPTLPSLSCFHHTFCYNKRSLTCVPQHLNTVFTCTTFGQIIQDPSCYSLNCIDCIKIKCL